MIAAEDGVEGVRQFRGMAERVDVVLMDLTMPRMGGIEAFRELRRLCRTVPVILMSGYSEHDVANQLADEGLSGFLQKPFSAGDLIAARPEGPCFLRRPSASRLSSR